MRPARRYLPAIAALLTLVVGGLTTDLLPCADEECGVWHVLLGTHPDLPEGEGYDPGPEQQSETHDCLCHVTYTSTARPVALFAAQLHPSADEPRPALRAPVPLPVPTPPPRG